MKKVTYVTVYWGDEYGRPPKTSTEKALDEALAQGILQRVERVRNIRLTEVSMDGYHLEGTGDEAFRFLMEILQPAAHLVNHSSVRVWKSYNRRELELAPLLVWRLTNQSIEDDWFDLEEDGYQGGPGTSHRRCSVCRAEMEQVRDLLLDVRKMGKRDVSLTYSFEIILSPRLARMLQEASFTGFTLQPVWHARKPHHGEPSLYQMVMTNILPPMASPPTQFEHGQRCEACGTETKFLKHTHWWGRVQYYEETSIHYPTAVLERTADFNATWEQLGELSSWRRLLVISPRVYRWLQEQGVRGWSAEPVVLVE